MLTHFAAFYRFHNEKFQFSASGKLNFECSILIETLGSKLCRTNSATNGMKQPGRVLLATIAYEVAVGGQVKRAKEMNTTIKVLSSIFEMMNLSDG